MRIRASLFLVTLAAVLVAALPSSAQVVTGVPPFGSFSGGPDVIDNANLNVHYTIPVRQRAGRGINFVYNLAYDSSIWRPVSSGSTKVWTPSAGWGWSAGVAAGGQQYITYNVAFQPPIICNSYRVEYETWTFTNFVYYDIVGTPHSFNTSATYISLIGGTQTQGCPTPGATYNGDPIGADGFTMNYGVNAGSAYLNSLVYLNGSKYTVPIGTNPPGSSGSTSVVDRNGNIISSSNGVYTDTIGTALGGPALTVTNGSNSTTLSYTSPSGVAANYYLEYSTQTIQTKFNCSGITEFSPTSKQLVSEVVLPDGSQYNFTYETTPGDNHNPHYVTGRIASVMLPTGGTIAYTYTGGSNGVECADGSTSGLNRSTPDTGSQFWAYTRTLGTNGGPNTTTITDPASNVTSLDFQGIYETERDIDQGSSTPLETIYTCYNNSTSPPCNSTVVSAPITKRSVTVKWAGGQESQKLTTYNTNGLPTEVDEYGYANGTHGSLARKTQTTYAGLGNGIVNLPSQVTVQDGSSNTAAQTTYSYDGSGVVATSGTPQHNSVSGSRGNATTVSYWVSSSASLSKTFTYYDTGNVYQATDVNNATTTYNYANSTATCGNTFSSGVSEPMSLSQSMTWNCSGGVATSITDENEKMASYSYSSDRYFWRANSATDQMSNATNFSYSGQTSGESTLLFNGGNSTADSLSTLDDLGRLHVAQKKQSPSGNYDSVETDYDSLGQPNNVTLPYSAAGGQTCSGCTSTTAVLDALGRLTSVCEITSASGSASCPQTTTGYTGYFTGYTYDALDDLTRVIQGSQTRSYWFDGLGRMTKESNPESGTTIYFYDTMPSGCYNYGDNQSGNLTGTTDANGNTGCYHYDPVHRLMDVGSSGPNAASCKRFRYDVTSDGVDGSAPSGITVNNVEGRLMEAETDNCSAWPPTQSSILTDEWFSYNARGEMTDVWESTPHSGRYYHASAAYWPNGTLDQLTESTSGYGLTYAVDGEGRIYSSGYPAGSTNYLSSTIYNTASQPTAVNFASGDSDTFSYYPNSGDMAQYSFNVNSQHVIGTLNWNANGSLGSLSITDPFNSANSQICSASHDDLSRIASYNCGAVWSQTFSYDAFGNIGKSGTESFLPTYSSSTNHMTSIGGQTPSYDADGHVLNDFLNSYAWDAYGRPVTVNGVAATYDALGRMVEENNGGTYSEFVYSPTGFKMEIMNGGALVKAFAPLSGGAVRVYDADGSYYFRHADWLGSSRLASTASRTVYYDGAYGPFGEPYAQSGTSDLDFTGMNRDTAANVYDFPAREYGIQGRWPSPDPAGLAAVDPTDPQTWNRYAYVRNSPLEAIDPTGLWCAWQDGTHDPDPGEDGGVDQAGCLTAGGMWDPSDTITGCDADWSCTTPGGRVQGCPPEVWSCSLSLYTSVQVTEGSAVPPYLDLQYLYWDQPTLPQVQVALHQAPTTGPLPAGYTDPTVQQTCDSRANRAALGAFLPFGGTLVNGNFGAGTVGAEAAEQGADKVADALSKVKGPLKIAGKLVAPALWLYTAYDTMNSAANAYQACMSVAGSTSKVE